MASNEKCFTFKWKLENFSYCLQKMGECIKSSTFVVDEVDETKWYLGIYPRGKDDRNHIGFYLFRHEHSKGSARVLIKYELTLIAEDDTVLKSQGTFKVDFPKNHGRGFPQFEKRENIFVTKRSTFLPQDALIARCRIWKSDSEIVEDVRCFAHTRIGVQKRSFQWNVKSFSGLEPDKKYTYQIKSIESNAPLMSIDLYISLGVTSNETICFELTLQDKSKTFNTLRLSLVDASGNRVECNQEEFWYEDPSKSKQFKFFFSKNTLMAMKSSYLPDDILSLFWEWAFSEGVASESIEEVQYSLDNSENKFSNAVNVNNKNMAHKSPTMNNNLKSLYEENFLCDVKLMTKTSTFNAHKVLLSASSSVFKAMFSSDMKEKDSGSVNIEDLSDDTMNGMLSYIYTARIEDLNWERSLHLYVAADKYAILGLKNICSSYLKDNLSPSNATEALLLSDVHSDGDLKSCVQSYILRNIKYVVNCEEWKLLMETNAKLAAETACLQFK